MTKIAGMRVRRERGGKASGAKGRRQIINQFRGCDKERIEAILNRAIRDGDREMRFAPTGFAAEDQTVALRREVRPTSAEPRSESRTVD